MKLNVTSILLVSAFALFFLAACGGSSEPDGTATATPPPNSANTSTTQPTATTTNNTAPTASEACGAFDNASGFGGGFGLPATLPNIISGAQGGPNVQAQHSENPPSNEAEAIANFVEQALEDALDGDVSAQCYWEVSASEDDNDFGRALWVSLELPDNIPAGATQSIISSLTSMGATDVGSFSGMSGEQNTTMIIFGGLPVAFEGETGGMLLIMDEFAVLIAGQSIEDEGDESTPMPNSSGAGEPTSNPQANATPRPTAQVPQSVQGIVDWFQDTLEEELDITLEVQSSFQSTQGSASNLLITFTIPDGSALPDDVADRFEDIVRSGNATVESKINFQGAAIVNFIGLEIEGVTAAGAASLSQDQKTILITLGY